MKVKKVKIDLSPMKIKIDSKFISAMTINGVEYDVVRVKVDGDKCDQCDMEKLGGGQCLFYRILRENAQCPLEYIPYNERKSLVFKRRRNEDAD